MKNVLVVFEEVPENTYFLVLKCNDEQIFELIQFDGNFINRGKNESIEKLINDYFYGKDGIFKFENEKVKTPYSADKIDLVIHTGFIL